MNEDLKIRQQYIRTNNELNKGINSKTLVQGNKNKVELDRKLEELSINSGVSFSGNLIRQNILNSSASHATTLNNTINYEEFEKDDEKTNAENSLKDGINRGRDNIRNINNMKDISRNNNNNNIDKLRFNNFNKNI